MSDDHQEDPFGAIKQDVQEIRDRLHMSVNRINKELDDIWAEFERPRGIWAQIVDFWKRF